MIEHRNTSAGLPDAYGRCSCGYRVTRLFGARRAIDRHVREATELEVLRAQTRELEESQRARESQLMNAGRGQPDSVDDSTLAGDLCCGLGEDTNGRRHRRSCVTPMDRQGRPTHPWRVR